MNLTRRTLLKSAVASAVCATPVFSQTGDRLNVGYLHTPAVDGQIWIGEKIGAFAAQNLSLNMVQFTTGLELFQAMIGGSLDVISTGAVLSNFPARGQGKVFLLNNIEYATAQLWVDASIRTLADLKGKRISTAVGTTAHVFLSTALQSAGLDPARDVSLVNQRMTEAVTAFISGAVPAVALWVPFDTAIRENAKSAHMLVDASSFYPEAAILGGWAARNDVHAKRPAVLKKLVRGWRTANDWLIQNLDESVAHLQANHYPQLSRDAMKTQMAASKYFSAAQWRDMIADGTATQWLQKVSDFFIATGGIRAPVPAAEYFDTSIFLQADQA